MMGFRYEWRKMISDGRLIQPDIYGDSGQRINVNLFNGFETEQEAVDHLNNLDTGFYTTGFYTGEWVLVRFYHPKKKEPKSCGTID